MYANLFFLKYYTSRMLQPYCPNSVIILLSFLWLPSVLQPSKQTFALWSYGDRFSVIASSVMNAATETWKNGLTMMYPHETGLPLRFSQRSPAFYSVFSLQILVFFFLWRTRYSTRLQRVIRLSIYRNEISSHKLWLIALRSSQHS